MAERLNVRVMKITDIARFIKFGLKILSTVKGCPPVLCSIIERPKRVIL